MESVVTPNDDYSVIIVRYFTYQFPNHSISLTNARIICFRCRYSSVIIIALILRIDFVIWSRKETMQVFGSYSLLRNK